MLAQRGKRGTHHFRPDSFSTLTEAAKRRRGLSSPLPGGPPRMRLLSLPPELRNMIWREVLRYPRDDIGELVLVLAELSTAQTPNASTRLQFLLTCRQIYCEVQFMAFSSTIFCFRLAMIPQSDVAMWTYCRPRQPQYFMTSQGLVHSGPPLSNVSMPHLLLPAWTAPGNLVHAFSLRNKPVLSAVTTIAVDILSCLRLNYYNYWKLLTMASHLPAIEMIYLLEHPDFDEGGMSLLMILVRLAQTCTQLKEIVITERPSPQPGDLSPSWDSNEYGYAAHGQRYFKDLWNTLTLFREELAAFLAAGPAGFALNWFVAHHSHPPAGPHVQFSKLFGGRPRDGQGDIEIADQESREQLRLHEKAWLMPYEMADLRKKLLERLNDRTTAKMLILRPAHIQSVTIKCMTHREAHVIARISDELKTEKKWDECWWIDE